MLAFWLQSLTAAGHLPDFGTLARVWGDPENCQLCPRLAGQRGGALSVPAVERFILELESLSLVIGSGEKFHSRASTVTRRPRADTRGRRFNVLQPRIREGGADVEAAWETSSLQSDGSQNPWELSGTFSLSPWVQSRVQGARRPLCKIN